MTRVHVLYPATAGLRFDEAYYRSTHLPLVRRCLGDVLLGMELERGVHGTGPDQPPAFAFILRMTVRSGEAFLAAFGVHAQAILADVPHYTDAQPVLQLAEIVDIG